MDALITQQMEVSGLIHRFWANTLKKGEEKLTAAALETRKEVLHEYWRDFMQRHFQIIAYPGYETSQYAKSDVFGSTEEARLSAAGSIADRLKTISEKSPSQPPPASGSENSADFYRQIQLPRLSLPTFSGDQLEWESFRDLFKSLVVDVAGIPGVQKLQHLKGSLTGEAADVIRNVPITDAAFQGAWGDLLQRYDNKRVILCTHMRTLLECPAAKGESPAELKRLLGVVQQSRRAFKALKRPVDKWDDWLVHILAQKLDPSSRLHWETSLADSREFPTLVQLTDHLENRIRALEAAGAQCAGPPKPASTSTSLPRRRSTATSLTVAARPSTKPAQTCPLCKTGHPLNHCSRYRKLSAQLRVEEAKKLGVCMNCLRLGHRLTDCPSQGRCFTCQGRHHSLLHDANSPAPGGVLPSAEASSPSSQSRPSVTTLAMTSCNAVLMGTAIVELEAPSGQALTVRALLDPASEVSIVTERVVQALRLNKRTADVEVNGVQGARTGVAKSEVSVLLRSRLHRTFRIPVQALVLRSLTTTPSRELTNVDWPHIQGLPLADPDFATPSGVDLLLSAEVYATVLEGGLRRGPPGSPVAILTTLGWVLTGSSAPSPTPALSSSVTTLCCHVQDPISTALQRFWESEALPTEPVLSDEERQCEEHFRLTHSRDSTGRYTVRLPIRTDEAVNLGESRRAALRVLLSSERRRLQSPTLQSKYADFMDEYLAMGHMESVSEPEEGLYYLPHHAVIKAHDPSSKIRVVFNASAKTSTGVSLNDRLLVGPRLQSDLWTVLTRWRFFRVAFSADIVKMFRQVRVHPGDADLQRILWRADTTLRIQEFRLTTVTYGTASAPFLALRVLKQLAEDEQERFPLGAEAIRRHSYVDDILTGADDVSSANAVRSQLVAILRAGGFELSKWASNCPLIGPNGEEQDKLLTIDPDAAVSTLGLKWSPGRDVFQFNADAETIRAPLTKRGILSEIARLFDPLGWLSPVLIRAKILLQDLWLLGIDWDTAVPPALVAEWTAFQAELPLLQHISIPRWIGATRDGASLELHAFCDASERAYAAAAYIRVQSPSGEVQVHLLHAKTKVAPVKTLSIPRLELNGALTLARLVNALREGLAPLTVPVHAWTDSAVVLAWLRGHPSRWKPFVAHRVSEIQASVPTSCWRHVGTAYNPADAPSRGIDAEQLRTSRLWWHGPQWLQEPPDSWPNRLPSSSGSEDVERRGPVSCTTLKNEDDGGSVIRRFSQFSRLLRVTAFCRRFAHNVRKPTSRAVGPLSPTELRAALTVWVRASQQSAFAEELSLARKGADLPRRSHLRLLAPFLDDDGLLRVGGRLQEAALHYDGKHPYIIPRRSHLARLLVLNAHLSTLHGGVQLTRNYLQGQFWIPRGAPLIRQIVRSCVRCIRFRGLVHPPFMGQLPEARVRPSRPFYHSGVDYAGPLLIRTSPGRGHKAYKGYICLFVCLASKAIHLEAVSDLTTPAFLAAFSRFVARRGRCAHLLSDNGTTFRGADAELRQRFSKASIFYEEAASSLANDGTSWRFIPPHAPHFGGLWEAGVKSVKHHLRRIIGEQKLTFEELTTLLCKVEACLNSRPLTPLSEDPMDVAALTPGHFLIGEPLIAEPEPDSVLLRASLSTRWRQLSAMRDHFWRRWSHEYMHQLQTRSKWTKQGPQLHVGTLVLVKEDNFPPTKWALGRVVALHPGQDGVARVATIKMATSTLRRPVTKLCVLPAVHVEAQTDLAT